MNGSKTHVALGRYVDRAYICGMKTIDFRSDTVTKPTPAMREVIANAEVGDDVFGDDPSVIELQRYVADLFGREASLYVPSGTMANQICLKLNAEPGTELLCDRECHVVNYEVAGPVVHAGLLVNLLQTDKGMITAEMVRDNVRPINLHTPRTTQVALENTHNRHGGTVLPQEEILKVREVCDEFGLKLHLDGARIWNAHIATGLSLEELTAPFDTISVCLSKGLGAPVGSMIVASQEFIEKALRQRKLFGGGMRQVGIIASAGLYAVKNNIERLSIDHDNAQLLGKRLNELDIFEVDLDRLQTNIVLIDIRGDSDAETVLAQLKERHVWAVPFGKKRLRFVTHLGVSRQDCEEALRRIEEIFS